MTELEADNAREWLRADVKAPLVGVDRAARVLRGAVLATEGVFKDRRGEFDSGGIADIVRLANAARGGLKSRLGHPTLSSDGVGRFLGRARNARADTAVVRRDGKEFRGVVARADLHLDPTASKSPEGDLAAYVLDLAESDPDAFGMSLVLQPEELFRKDKKGKALTDEQGRELPPLWIPKVLHAVDVVDDGDATDGMLSAETMAQALSVGLTPELQKLLRFDNVARLGAQLLDGLFAGRGRDEVERRCKAWLDRYLSHRFPDPEAVPTPVLDGLRTRLMENALAVQKMVTP